MVLNANERFEILGDLYLARTGRLRPGKSASSISGVDPMSDENRAQFAEWLANQAFEDALCRIGELNEQVRGYENL